MPKKPFRGVKKCWHIFHSECACWWWRWEGVLTCSLSRVHLWRSAERGEKDPRMLSFWRNIELDLGLREADMREKCSFFEHCSKGLWPPPPLFVWTSCGEFFKKRFYWEALQKIKWCKTIYSWTVKNHNVLGIGDIKLCHWFPKFLFYHCYPIW